MADIGYVRGLLRGIPDEKTRTILTQVFEHTYGNLRFGDAEHQTRAENFQAYFYASTTASDTGTEVSIAHGLGVTPNMLIPILDVRQVGARLPAIEVSRAADSQRVYLKCASGSTSAAFKVLIE